MLGRVDRRNKTRDGRLPYVFARNRGARAAGRQERKSAPQIKSVPMWGPLTRTLLVLTFVTGIVDAVSFLALGQVFAAMQTGNVIFLGLGVAGAPGAPVLAPLVALGAFLAGGTAAALLMRP